MKLNSMVKFGLVLYLLLFAFSYSEAYATEHQQSTQEIKDTAKQFLTKESNGIANAKRVSIEIGKLDSKLNLTPCALLEAFMPSGSRLWGKTSVGVRCLAPQKWTVYVPGMVRVWGDYYVTARTVAQNQTITESDISVVEGDLTTLANGVVTDPSQAVGRTSAMSLAAGMPLRQGSLRVQPLILQGQSIQLVSSGQGFNVSTEGQALNNASEGQLVKVKINSGQVISGIAKLSGVVEVR